MMAVHGAPLTFAHALDCYVGGTGLVGQMSLVTWLLYIVCMEYS